MPEGTETEVGALVADRYLYLDAAGAVVEAGDPKRASLLIAPGLPIPAATVTRLGLTADASGKVTLPGAAPTPEPAAPVEAAGGAPDAPQGASGPAPAPTPSFGTGRPTRRA